MRVWGVVALLCAGGIGCGGGDDGPTESQFTLTVELPAASTPDDPLQVLIQIRPQTVAFEDDWAIEAGDEAAPLEMDRTMRQYVLPRADVGDGMTNDLHVKIRFCEDAECASPHSARWLQIRQAYYRQAQTAHTERIDSIPATPPMDPITIDPCDIRGCEEDRAAGDDDYCREDGRHYCIKPPREE